MAWLNWQTLTVTGTGFRMAIAEWRCLARDCSSGMTLLGVLEQCEAVKWTLAVFLSLAELRPLPRGLV